MSTLGRKLARLGSAGPGSRAKASVESATPTVVSDAGDALAAALRDTPAGDALAAALRDTPAGDALAAALRDAPVATRVERLRTAMHAVIARTEARVTTPVLPAAAPSWRVPGEVQQTPEGPVHFIDTYLEPSHHHGQAPVAGALAADARLVAQLALDTSLEGVDLSRALYLDTETTGLSGGTGTVPFLVGMAWFEGRSLRVQQLFLPELGREAPMLAVLADRIAQASCVVTYNGKAFDWPLLRTRFVMNRVPAPRLPPHLDLLCCVRRGYKARLRTLRLVEVEVSLLHMVREDDVHGSEIPGIYMQFLREGHHPFLSRVIEHNGHDLVALAALLGELSARYAEVRLADDPLDHLSFARIAYRAGDSCRAHRFAEAAAGGGGSPECAAEAWWLRALMARKAHAPSAQEQALIESCRHVADGRLAARAHLALAKLYEHRYNDLDRALAHASLASLVEDSEAHARRLSRLARKRAAAGMPEVSVFGAPQGMLPASLPAARPGPHGWE